MNPHRDSDSHQLWLYIKILKDPSDFGILEMLISPTQWD